MKRNYDLSWDDYAAIDERGEGAAETYAVDLNGCWYKNE